MSGLFYPKLALTNLKSNGKLYLPYILTYAATVLMFYNMCALMLNSNTGDGSLMMMLGLGVVVNGFFAVIFLFYINSFLLKRRKKDLAVFSILGMERSHLQRVVFFENLFTNLSSIFLGITFGIIFNRLITLLLCKMLRFNPGFDFEISLQALGITVALFLAIFFLTLLDNFRRVLISNPIKLLADSSAGERDPKANWAVALLGIVSLGAGYKIALTVENPMDAALLFFVAVALVIIGTYCLFISGSIWILKALRKNKNFYYKPENFTAISGMIYRMKQNAAGLSSICILSCAVLVMLSSTFSMYMGTEGMLKTRYPWDITLSKFLEIDPSALDAKGTKAKVLDIVSSTGHKIENFSQRTYLSFSASKNNNEFSFSEVSYSLGANTCTFIVLTADEYMAITNNPLALSPGEIAVYNTKGLKYDTMSLGNDSYRVKYLLENQPFPSDITSQLVETNFLIVSDSATFFNIYNQAHGAVSNSFKHDISFDILGDSSAKIQLHEALNSARKSDIIDVDYIDNKEAANAAFYSMYGGLLFVGIFLGLLFLMITVLIMYYKQIAEGYEDTRRFEIMQKVGMSKSEVRRSIQKQVLMVFFIPLIMSIIHISVAFPITTHLLALLNLTDVNLFAICTVICIMVFALFYTVAYALTAKTYHKIVNGQ